MPLLFNLKDRTVISTFDYVSKKLYTLIERNIKVFTIDIVILKIGENNKHEHFYLDKETAEKYGACKGIIVSTEEYLQDTKFDSFLEDIDIIHTLKLEEYLSSLE